MPIDEKKLIKCNSCQTTYNVIKLKPGNSFRCKKCETIITIPEKPIDKTPPDLKPAPQRPGIKPITNRPKAVLPQLSKSVKISRLSRFSKNPTPKTYTTSKNKLPLANLENTLIPGLKNIQNKKSKFGSLTLFIATLIIFFSAGIISFKWQEIFILIGVILFHELGHFLAMKIFKYNDVKMFFIPLVGAAVSGKSRKDTATKSCVVSALGPLPGILLGILLYILFLLTRNYYIFKIAEVMLVLNAFNFLPIMPLDGGRYIDTLFVNQRYFRLFFALLGASFFIFFVIVLSSIIFGVLGLLFVLGAFYSFKLHRISIELKSEGVNTASVEELIENRNLLQVVIDKLYKEYPKSFKPRIIYKTVHGQVTTIVDTIKFVPAKLLPKLALLAFYFIIAMASIIVTFVFVGMSYKEVARIDDSGGNRRVVAETYLFGSKIEECPINNSLLYDGEGRGFFWESKENPISDIFYYSNGYRTGEWLTFNEYGDTIQKKIYQGGQLLSVSEIEDGEWKTYSYDELPFWDKLRVKVRQIAQPHKSNHEHFEKE